MRDPEIRDPAWMDGYLAAIADAEQRYAPLSAAIKTATGLDSSVFQSGGMVMVLVSHVDGPQGAGREYHTQVDTFHPDGTLTGGSSFHDHPAAVAKGRDDDMEGTVVFDCYRDPNDAEGVAVTPERWAAALLDHVRTIPPPASEPRRRVDVVDLRRWTCRRLDDVRPGADEHAGVTRATPARAKSPQPTGHCRPGRPPTQHQKAQGRPITGPSMVAPVILPDPVLR